MYSSSKFQALCHATLDNVITWKDQTDFGKQGKASVMLEIILVGQVGRFHRQHFIFPFTVFSYFQAAQNSEI